MKINPYLIATVVCLVAACGSPQHETEDSLPLKVAEAYGFAEFEKLGSLQYTWNVRVDSATVRSRAWVWSPASGEIRYSGADTTVSYLQSEKDSSLNEVDSRFINDKYWLLFPFQLAWDQGNYDYQSTPGQPAPISGVNTTKLTVVYNEEDGYTPGDAYDLFLDEEYRIKEWVFRRGNGATGRAMTWDNVKDFDGIKISMDHKDEKGNTVLWFSDVSVVTD
jgi:hypothetical protein